MQNSARSARWCNSKKKNLGLKKKKALEFPFFFFCLSDERERERETSTSIFFSPFPSILSSLAIFNRSTALGPTFLPGKGTARSTCTFPLNTRNPKRNAFDDVCFCGDGVAPGARVGGRRPVGQRRLQDAPHARQLGGQGAVPRRRGESLLPFFVSYCGVGRRALEARREQKRRARRSHGREKFRLNRSRWTRRERASERDERRCLRGFVFSSFFFFFFLSLARSLLLRFSLSLAPRLSLPASAEQQEQARLRALLCPR